MDLKKAICSLFEVYPEPNGVQRVVTPIEYAGTGDRIVVRVRQRHEGFTVDENGEACFHASMAGGDVESEVVSRWAEDLAAAGKVRLQEDETLSAVTTDPQAIAPLIFRVAEAAQQLHAIATARTERQASDFKARLAAIVSAVAADFQLGHETDVQLPIAGGMVADHLLRSATPLIVVAATSATRLLEAEVIHMQYRMERKAGFVLAVVENQNVVGKRQFERANYYTGKTVTFNEHDFGSLLSSTLN
ncbi:hypothetical protein [Caballeronia sp. BCC1704]|uniref:hypothetical protein n=1 Tax=Caballeronia sp. BCC1704 TaxID=2676300 RepID=UPI00158C8F63|nr:hypothetical protein [Caballeronia sp. BCC1704]